MEHDDPTNNLDTLFSALKIAPDEASSKAIEERIWALWLISGSDTCNLLMARAKAATDAKDYDLALKLLDAIVEIKPDYVEGWNRRATIYYLKDDYAHAIADIGEVLAREPRHFGALSGLGQMLQEIGDDKDALEAYRKALVIDPHLEHIPEHVQTKRETNGKPLSKPTKELFKPTVMFFRMCNSPATFQAMMDNIFAAEIDGKLVIEYMDDIL